MPNSSDDEPADRGRVEGKLNDSSIAFSNLETILQQPVPEIWFTFDCRMENVGCIDGKLKNKISSEGQPLIEKQWKETLEFVYRDRLKKFADAQDMYDETQTHFAKTLRLVKELKNYEIQTPNSSRKISDGEAGDIAGFLVKSADQIIERAKQN